MVLKSYRLTRNKKKKRKKRTALGDITTGAIGALLGVALLSETAQTVRRI